VTFPVPDPLPASLPDAKLPAPEPAPAPYVDPVRARLIAIGEILLCSSIPTQLALQIVLQAAGWSPVDASGQLSLPFVVTQSLGDTVLLIALMVIIMRAHGESPRALWIGQRRVGHEVALGLLLVPLVFLAVVIMLNLFRLFAPWLHNVEENPLERLAGTPVDAALFALVAIFAGGVREELQRAFLLRRFEQHLGGPAVGVLVLSMAFGLGHIVQGWDAVITTGALGGFWAILYLRRRSSIAPVVSHAGFNALEIARVAITG
jgi:membrane protease YdiL (CAAX protease family)